MILSIAKQEITAASRDKRIVLLLMLLLVLLSVSMYIGQVKYRQLQQFRTAAQQEKRAQWLHQDPKHPHMAAHFGNFVFKPITPLNWLDYGVDSYSGTYVYLEPHRQNDFVFTPAQEQHASIRLGELSPALILQVFVPLLIIFLCFAAMTKERENGVLRLLLAQGITMGQLVRGKILGYFLLVLIMVLPLIIGILVAGNAFRSQTAAGIFSRFALLLVGYMAYFFILVSLTIWISAMVKTSRASMLVSLACWITFIVILPKSAANLGSDLYALPSNEAFASAVKQDILQGIDGHNPDSARGKELIDATLKKYQVASLQELPVNIEGIIMQKAEDYSSLVYDKHFGHLQQTLRNQNRLSSMAGWLDPALAMRNISMALSLTDPFSHTHFQQAAEHYRRSFVQQMNADMTHHSKEGEFGTYKINTATYATVNDFTYRSPTVLASLAGVRWEIAALIAWFLALLFIIHLFVHKIPAI